MTRVEKRFVALLASVVVIQAVGFGFMHFFGERTAEPDGSGEPLLTQPDDLQFPPPLVEWHTIEGPSGELSVPRFPPNTQVTDFPMLDVPQHVPENGILPPTKRERTFSYSANSAGIRGSRDFTPEPPPGVFRIGVLGTGVTFGLGVDDDEVFTAQLQALLDDKPVAGKQFEVLNFGRPGMCVRDAKLTLEYWSSLFRCDLWIVLLGVNDSLPCFNVSLDEYSRSWQELLDHLATLGGPVVLTIEPVNTFYPWLHLYKTYDKAMRQLVGNRFPVIDLSSHLDCYEREDGLRLEVTGDTQQLVRYEQGTPHVEFAVEYHHPGPDSPSVPKALFDFLDGTQLRLRTFLTDVHLNEFGHQVVAGALYKVVDAVVSGRKPALTSRPECRVFEPED